jgi:hypothetical protein
MQEFLSRHQVEDMRELHAEAVLSQVPVECKAVFVPDPMEKSKKKLFSCQVSNVTVSSHITDRTV